MISNGDKNTFSEISQSSDVLVDFWAPWCQPCKALEKQIEILDEKYPYLAILRVNVDDHRDFASEFYVQNIPTLVWVKFGQAPVALTGFQTADTIARRLGI